VDSDRIGDELALPDPAGVLDLAAIADGRYTVRLFAQDKAGLSGEARIVVDVDKTPPVVAIAAPLDGGFLRPSLDSGNRHGRALRRVSSVSRFRPERRKLSFSEIGLGVAAVSDGLLLD
jgi:hypothetical protein